MPDKLRIAIAGAGPGRGQIWPETVTKLDDIYEFCAMCEPVPERAAENERRWGVPVYPTLDEMFADARPDVVLSGVPSDAQHLVVAIAARHGVHAITEIPVAPTGPMTQFVIAAAREAGIKHEVAENVYRWASERLKQKIIASGVIGQLKHARLWYTSGCYHGFNAIRFLLNAEARRVLGYVGTIPVPYYVDYLSTEVPDQVWEGAIIEFDSGVACLYEKPPQGLRASSWEIEGTDGALVGDELRLHGHRAAQTLPFQWEYTQLDGQRVLDHVRVDTDPPVVWENPFKRYRVSQNDEVARVDILVSFYKAVTQDAPVAYPPEQAWPDQEIWIALRQSAMDGNVWVDLPLTHVTAFEQALMAAYEEHYGCPWDDIECLSKVAFKRGGVRWHVGRML